MVRVDGSRYPEVAARYRVSAFPTLVFLRSSGEVAAQEVGARSADWLVQRVRGVLLGG